MIRRPLLAPLLLLIASGAAAEEELPDLERALAARCGSELAWAPSWAAAAATGGRERRAVLVYIRRLRGFAISDPPLRVITSCP